MTAQPETPRIYEHFDALRFDATELTKEGKRRFVPVKPAKLGTPETILGAGCDGGGLTLLRADVLAWDDDYGPTEGQGSPCPEADDRPREVFWMERNEALCCDLLDEDDQVGSPFAKSEFRSTFQEAVAAFMDRYSWWMLYPSEVHPDWREAVAAMIEQRFPGWRGVPSRYAEDMHNVREWIEILKTPPPVLSLTYVIRSPKGGSRGIRVEIGSIHPPRGQRWELPMGSQTHHEAPSEWAMWKPDVPGAPLDEKEVRWLFDTFQEARMGLSPAGSERGEDTERTLAVAMGANRMQVKWGEALPYGLADLKDILYGLLEGWTRPTSICSE